MSDKKSGQNKPKKARIRDKNPICDKVRVFIQLYLSLISWQLQTCRESRFVTNTRFFGFVLSRLLLRHLGFDSDFVQISEQKLAANIPDLRCYIHL